MLDGGRVGIALPDTPLHRRHVERIRAAMDKLEIAVLWVAPNGAVAVESSRPLA
jgi:hypothetical protein